jgi:hypothetical protein
MSIQSARITAQLSEALEQFLQCSQFNDVPMDKTAATEYIKYLNKTQIQICATDSELVYQYLRVMMLRLKSKVRMS